MHKLIILLILLACTLSPPFAKIVPLEFDQPISLKGILQFQIYQQPTKKHPGIPYKIRLSKTDTPLNMSPPFNIWVEIENADKSEYFTILLKEDVTLNSRISFFIKPEK